VALSGFEDRWDADRPWVWATDAEGWELDVPVDAASELRDAAAAAPRLAHGLELTVVEQPADGDGEPRREIVSGQALATLITARTGLVASSELAGVQRASDDISELADAVGVLEVVLTIWLDEAGAAADDAGQVATWATTTSRARQEMQAPLLRRVRPRRNGTFRVRLFEFERDVVRSGLDQLADGLTSGDPALRRLFPTAYPQDEERQAGWAALAHGELIESRLAAIASVRASLDQASMTESELAALMRSINDIRLVLGTVLDVGEDGAPQGEPDAEQAQMLAVYEHLGLLLYDVIAALRTTL
jgi:hypothetical protein